MLLRDAVDMADTPGGHIVIAVTIGCFGTAIAVVAFWYGHDMVAAAVSPMTGFFSTAAYAMRGTDKATARVTEDSVKHTAAPEEEKK